MIPLNAGKMQMNINEMSSVLGMLNLKYIQVAVS